MQPERFLPERAEQNTMRVINTAGIEIRLKSQEVCIIWFLMTGMKPRDISLFMQITEQNVSYYKRKTMKKLQVKNNFEFFSWFRCNRSVFNSEKAESYILKRSEF
ncbi:LuxR C-terminal-related transcriptional regulator [Pantoea sp. NSTU24]|uniref:LuxR C-terminal-related transcriptional regulator n=1 Tax=Pantoea sp. NSTU24 TaxID=3391144 RepID=UPI003CFC1A94